MCKPTNAMSYGEGEAFTHGTPSTATPSPSSGRRDRRTGKGWGGEDPRSIGSRVERLFVQACVRNGVRCDTAPHDRDYYHHVDFSTDAFGEVEVKAPKRICRADREPSRTHTAVEVLSAEDAHHHNHEGWVFGKSRHIAFGSPDLTEFIMVPTQNLQEVVRTWKYWPTVYEPSKSLQPFTTYSRDRGRRGIIVQVPYDLLLNMATCRFRT